MNFMLSVKMIYFPVSFYYLINNFAFFILVSIFKLCLKY
jgi:hypothetical protein